MVYFDLSLRKLIFLILFDIFGNDHGRSFWRLPSGFPFNFNQVAEMRLGVDIL